VKRACISSFIHISEARRVVARHKLPLVTFFVTHGIKWPEWPGYGFLTVFQITFSRSKRAPDCLSREQLSAESPSEANEIRS
jgi:hypothetical protein